MVDSSRGELLRSENNDVIALKNAMRNGLIHADQVLLAAYLGNSDAATLVGEPQNHFNSAGDFILDLCDWGPEVQQQLLVFFSESLERHFYARLGRYALENESLFMQLMLVSTLATEVRSLEDFRHSTIWDQMNDLLSDTRQQIWDYGESMLRTSPDAQVWDVGERMTNIPVRDARRILLQLFDAIHSLVDAKLCDDCYDDLFGVDDEQYGWHRRPYYLMNCAESFAKAIDLSQSELKSRVAEALRPAMFNESKASVQRANWLNRGRSESIRRQRTPEGPIVMFDKYPEWSFYHDEAGVFPNQEWPENHDTFYCHWICKSKNGEVERVVLLNINLVETSEDYDFPIEISSVYDEELTHIVEIAVFNQFIDGLTHEIVRLLVEVTDYVLTSEPSSRRGYHFTGQIPITVIPNAKSPSSFGLTDIGAIQLLIQHGIVSKLSVSVDDPQAMSVQQELSDWLTQNPELASTVTIQKI